MPETTRFLQLSEPRRLLVRLCQFVQFGQILGVQVRGGEPVFQPEPTVVLDLKLDCDKAPRSELELTDFVLRKEINRLMTQLDALEDGCVARIDVNAGIPRRILVEAKLSELKLWKWNAKHT